MKRFVEKWFWRLIPFFCVALLAYAILHDSKDNTWSFLPPLLIFLFGAALPIFAEMTNVIHIQFLKKQACRENTEAQEQLKQAEANVGKWIRFFLLTWICGVLIGVVFMLFAIFHQSSVPWYPQPDILSPGTSTHSVLTGLTWIFYVSGLLGILSMLSIGILFLVSILSKKRKRKQGLPRPVTLAFIITGFFFFCIFFSEYQVSRIIRKHVISFLISSSTSIDARVYINSKPASDPGRIISVLSEVRSYTAHHSHALDKFEIRIQDHGQTLTLQLGRDSSDDKEYWVFFPGFRSSPSEIGRITTDIFNELP